MVVGLALAYRSVHFFKNGEKVMAEVVDQHVSRDTDGADTYAPVFEYALRNHEVVRHQYWVHTEPATWKVGDRVPLIYNKENPQKVRLVSYFGLFRWSVISVSAGAICIVVGLGYVLFQNYFLK